jgi:hypothetical protein
MTTEQMRGISLDAPSHPPASGMTEIHRTLCWPVTSAVDAHGLWWSRARRGHAGWRFPGRAGVHAVRPRGPVLLRPRSLRNFTTWRWLADLVNRRLNPRASALMTGCASALSDDCRQNTHFRAEIVLHGIQQFAGFPWGSSLRENEYADH